MGTQLGDALKAALRAEPTKEAAQADRKRSTRATRAEGESISSRCPGDGRTAVARGGTPARAVQSPVSHQIAWGPDGFVRCAVFDSQNQARAVIRRPRKDGIAIDLLDGRTPYNETDLQMGFDFGTANLKVVIRDLVDRRAFAVPFTADPDNPYLLPAVVHEWNGAFSLEASGRPIEGLKLGLIRDAKALKVDEAVPACALTALGIRAARGWFLDSYSGRYRRHALNWSLAVGLPARSYEDAALVRAYRWICGAALAAASMPGPITREALERFLAPARDIPLALPVDVVPEISAQIAGMVESTSWDVVQRPYFVLVDVGAGTVDAAFFAVVGQRGSRRFVFYSSDVKPYGVLNLHFARVDWLAKALPSAGRDVPAAREYLDEIRKRAPGFGRFPNGVEEYFPGASITCPPAEHVDRVFRKDGLMALVSGCMGEGKRAQRFDREVLQRTAFIVSGGGSRMAVFAGLESDLARAWQGQFGLLPSRLRIPNDLTAPGLMAAEYDRLSVAYGLSLPNIGQIVRQSEVPPAPPPPKWDRSPLLVSKEMI